MFILSGIDEILAGFAPRTDSFDVEEPRTIAVHTSDTDDHWAVTLAPENPSYTFNLALALARQERWTEARTLFERTLELDPGATDARAWLREIDSVSAGC